MKKGRLSKKECDFIKKNYNRLSYEEIATYLERDTNSIRSFVEKKMGKNITFQEEREVKAEYDIKNRAYWKELKAQFSEDELEMFVFHWKRIIAQFKDEVYPTEEIQVVDMIKLEVLMNRILKEQQTLTINITQAENLLRNERLKEEGDRDVALITNLEVQLAGYRAAQSEVMDLYNNFLNKKKDILKELKGTRDQRVKNLENSKSTFIGWMTHILSDIELRKNLGIRMEKMRLATEAERLRLSEYHKYVNGELDQPLLSNDTVKD